MGSFGIQTISNSTTTAPQIPSGFLAGFTLGWFGVSPGIPGLGIARNSQELCAHHVISRQQLLQELGLLVLHGFDDELVVAGDVEERAAGPRVGQLDQGLAAQGILGKNGKTAGIWAGKGVGVLGNEQRRGWRGEGGWGAG